MDTYINLKCKAYEKGMKSTGCYKNRKLSE